MTASRLRRTPPVQEPGRPPMTRVDSCRSASRRCSRPSACSSPPRSCSRSSGSSRLALDPRNLLGRPTSLIPAGASLDAFARVHRPAHQRCDHRFLRLACNSFLLAVRGGAVLGGRSAWLAAYAFSRLNFRAREVLMIAILGVLMLPAVATIAPLCSSCSTRCAWICRSSARLNLRQSLVGVGLADRSGALPFAIWNLKGYLDTIPKELEEAAAVDGCTRNQSFFRIVLPLATPALAVTGFLGFIAGWTEFYFVSIFLNDPTQGFTLSLALNKMVGAFGQTPWSDFAAFSIMFAAPVSRRVLLLPAVDRGRSRDRGRQGITGADGPDGTRHQPSGSATISRAAGPRRACGAAGMRFADGIPVLVDGSRARHRVPRARVHAVRRGAADACVDRWRDAPVDAPGRRGRLSGLGRHGWAGRWGSSASRPRPGWRRVSPVADRSWRS